MEIKRCYETIIGASVGENQLYPVHTSYNVYSGDVTGLTINVTDGYINIAGTASADAQITVLPIAPEQNVPANHVSLILCEGWNGFSWARVGFGSKTLPYYMNKHTAAFYVATRIFITSGTTYNIHARFSATDLTAELGSTIADYIYSIESATAGSGIAKLREWGFLRGYQAFNAGSIESVEVTEKKCVGFNQYDKTTEVFTAYLGNSGGGNAWIYSSDSRSVIVKCLPNTQYYLHTSGLEPSIFRVGDISGELPTGTGWTIPVNKQYDTITKGAGVYTTSEKAEWLIVQLNASIFTDAKEKLCVNIYNVDRNGEYEPYSAHTYDLGTDTLRGLFKLDSNNNLYADGDVKTSDGVITRYYGTRAYQSGDESLADAITDGTTTVYKLTTPTTEQSTPFRSPQVCYPDGTEEFITENGVPVGHETRYEL